MYLKLIVLVVVAAMATFAQSTDSPFQVRYVANLDQGESYINITNSGATGADLQSGTAASITGSICVNVYAFAEDEQMVSCCSCPVTPNGLVSLKASADLFKKALTPVVETTGVIKLLATAPKSGSCTNSAAQVITGTQVPGMVAWGTTLHQRVAGTGTSAVTTYEYTETQFAPATLSAGELNRLGQLCNFIMANGSGFGVCASCTRGGQGAAHK
jgi:hypothetical protein